MPLAENTTKTVHPLPAQKIESDDKVTEDIREIKNGEKSIYRLLILFQ